MRSIAQIVLSFSKKEMVVFESYLDLKSGRNSKLKEFLSLIIIYPNESDEFYCNKVYGSKPNSRYSHLKSRFESLLINVCSIFDPKSKSSNAFFKREIYLSGNYYKWNILGRYGNDDLTEKYANSIIETDTSLNVSAMKMAVISSILIYRSKKLERDNFNRLKVKFLENFRLFSVFSKTLILSVEIFGREDSSLISEKTIIRELEEYFSSIDCDFLGIPVIRNYHFKLKVFYEVLCERYCDALISATEYNTWISDVDNIYYSDSNLAGSLMLMGNCSLYLGRYHAAYEYYIQASQKYKPGSNNTQSIRTHIMRALIYSENFYALTRYVGKVRLGSLNERVHSLTNYLLACSFFALKKYSKALTIISSKSILYNDKSGWRLGQKFLEMICLIELSDFDTLYYRLDSMRKLLYTLEYSKSIDRVRLYYLLVKELLKSGIDYYSVCCEFHNELKTCLSSSGKYKWDPLGYEVIRVDKWFVNKYETCFSLKKNKPNTDVIGLLNL